MARFILRFAVGLLGDWFCHKLNPRWEMDRAQKHLVVHFHANTEGARKALDDFTQILQRMARSFAELERGTNG